MRLVLNKTYPRYCAAFCNLERDEKGISKNNCLWVVADYSIAFDSKPLPHRFPNNRSTEDARKN